MKIKKKCEWLKNESNYFVTCKYFRLILQLEYSKDLIPFLDILIKKNENGVWMDL